MKTSTKILIGIVAIAIVVSVLSVGGWFVSTALAQGPSQGGSWGMMHDNQAVLTLLKSSENDLLQARQAGKSWLDIAQAKGVSEQALSDALLDPVNDMQAWMSQNYSQFNSTGMTDWMRQQITRDIRVTQFGTMTDMHVFGGGMMGNWNGSGGFRGMMNGGMMGNWNGTNNYGGMMGNWNGTNNYGGMMGNWNGTNNYGGMMRGWNNAPNGNPTPVTAPQN